MSLLQEEKSSLAYYIEDSKHQLEQSLQSQSVLQNTIEQQNYQIETVNQQLHQFDGYRSDYNKNIEEMHNEIANLKENHEIARQSLSECQQQLFTAMQQLSEKTHTYNEVVQQLTSTQQHVEMLEHEVLNLKQTLELKEREYSQSIETLKNCQLRDIETHYEEVLAAKDIDIQTARTHLEESLQQCHLLTEKLNAESRVKMALETKTSELQEKSSKTDEKMCEQLKLMEEEEKQLEEMRAIIEEQVVKIEELKKELFEKSNDYDSLIAEMDMEKKSTAQRQQTQAVQNEASSSTSKAQEPDDLTEPVSRVEHDVALYMLHQSDVRCEELTVELTHLLEERDTLQLRLSNAIREKEELRRKLGGKY